MPHVKIIYFFDPHLVNLIRENPRYAKLSLEEILGKFVSGCMMVSFVRSLFSLVCVLLLRCALVCVSTPILTPILFVVNCVRRERLICGDSSQRDIDIRKTIVVLKFDLWIT